MKYAVARSVLLLPLVLAVHISKGHGHRHGAYKSGHYHASGATLPTSSTVGPFSIENATANPAHTGFGTAGSITSTIHPTLQSTGYQASTNPPPPDSLSEAARAGLQDSCGGTVTVTKADTYTVTVPVPGTAAEAATSSTPDTQASVTVSSSLVAAPGSEVALSPTDSSPVSSSVAPVSQSSVPPIEKAVIPSVGASSSTPADTKIAASAVSSPVAASAVPKSLSASTPSLPFGTKRGLFITTPSPNNGDTFQDYVTAFNNNPGKISWIVDQYSGISDTPPLSKNFNFVPQCYDKYSDDPTSNPPNQWTTNAKNAVAAGKKYFLSFGEPNTINNQNFQMDAETGANTFMKMLQPYAVQDNIVIGSPGTLGGPDDITWQKDFLQACVGKGCKIGFIAAHWVTPCGPATAQKLADTFWGTVNQYKSIATDYSSQHGVDLKVWVDNFSLDVTLPDSNCSSDTQRQFFDIVIPQLDSDPMIAAYAYISNTDLSQKNGFINADGSLSDLGSHYATM